MLVKPLGGSIDYYRLLQHMERRSRLVKLKSTDFQNAYCHKFHIPPAPWENIGAARRGVVKAAEDIINGLVPGQSIAGL